MICWIINTILCALYRKEYKRYMNCSDVKQAQEEKLREILLKNKNTLYGKKYGFENIKNAEEYKNKVPLTTYEDYADYIEQIKKGEKNILTAEDVKLLEPTSGSNSASKLIPYTESLKKEFQVGIKAWLYSMYKNYPEIKKGKSYWSVTPIAGGVNSVNNVNGVTGISGVTCANSETAANGVNRVTGINSASSATGVAGVNSQNTVNTTNDATEKNSAPKCSARAHIPIGFEEDSEYFGAMEKYLMRLIFAAPEDIKSEKDMEKFYFKTASKLLSSHDLSFISVWSPSFLLLLMQYIEDNSDNLLQSLTKKRKTAIEKPLCEKNYCEVWKKLVLISCWGDGNAAHYLKGIKEKFPNVAIQPKGILATEGLISFPLGAREANEARKGSKGSEGSRISYYSHFFEFIERETGRIYLASELQAGKKYEVVLTTSGGLYRYCIGDIIEVVNNTYSAGDTNIYNSTDNNTKNPAIKFIGRKGIVSDLFGEKINEEFVTKIYGELSDKVQYFMLAPALDKYILYIKTEKIIEAKNIDNMLRDNFHYDYCRKLGQLKEVKIFMLTGKPEQEYTDYCLKKGQKLGDIKLRVLSLESGWDKILTGYLQKEKK